MSRRPIIELHAGDALVTIDPLAGGRVAQVEIAGLELLHDDPSGGPMTWGSYPMVPWAGRVRHGRFRFDGSEHALPINLAPHAIHGTGFTSEWQVVDAGRDYCELRTELTWALGGTAHQHLALTEHGLTMMLSVMAVQQPLPAVVGWHPWFRKPQSAELEFAAMHVRDADGIALADLVDPTPPPWDDCFVEPLRPLRLLHPGLTLTLESDCDRWVVYDEPAHATCVEPQSGPPDAFTIGGATRLEPGELLQRRFSIAWRG